MAAPSNQLMLQPAARSGSQWPSSVSPSCQGSSSDVLNHRRESSEWPSHCLCSTLCGSLTKLSASRLTSHKSVLLSPNMTFHRCNKLNPAALLPEKLDEEKHYCIVATNSLLLPRIDHGESPMNNPNLILFTDGSYYEDLTENTRLAMLLYLQCPSSKMVSCLMSLPSNRLS